MKNRQIKSLEESFREVGMNVDTLLEHSERRSSRDLPDAPVKPTTESTPASPAAPQTEAFQAVKKAIRSAAEKLKARLFRKKNRAANKKASKIYAKRNKKKIAKRAKLRLKKFGADRLAKLHAQGRRVMMAHADLPELKALREDLNTLSENIDVSKIGPYADAAFNAGYMAVMLGEVFELHGDMKSAETMYAASDRAADLDEAIGSAQTEEDVSAENMENLKGLLDIVLRGIRVHEGMGMPSLGESIDYAIQNKIEG